MNFHPAQARQVREGEALHPRLLQQQQQQTREDGGDQIIRRRIPLRPAPLSPPLSTDRQFDLDRASFCSSPTIAMRYVSAKEDDIAKGK